MGLRSKFIIILCAVTAAALLGLGLTLAALTQHYLFAQKQHDGIELTKLAAQVTSMLADRIDADPAIVKAKLDSAMQAAFADAFSWHGTPQATDVVHVIFEVRAQRYQRLNDCRWGEAQQGSAQREDPITTIFMPKFGRSVPVPKGMEIFAATKQLANGREGPVYRFKLALDEARFGSGSCIRVDIDRTAVEAVRNSLFFAIGFGVLLAMAVVVIVAMHLASTITRPLDILLKDMRIVARGDLTHQTKARSRDEIGLLANSFNRMTADLQIAQRAQVEQEKAAYELALAQEVQRHLLPAETPIMPGHEVAAHYQGAKAVSGDYFDFIPLADGLWGFIVADVSGKGIPGSMVMAITRTVVRLVAAKHQYRAAETLKEANRIISRQIKRGMFVTAVYAILDERSHTLTYASAGHNPMIIYRAATRGIELARAKGIALGFNEGPIFDRTITEHRTVLHPGDGFVLYTDGFPEAMDAAQSEFGEERFYALIAANGHLDPRRLNLGLVNEIAKHRGEAEQSDDLTLITLRRLP